MRTPLLLFQAVSSEGCIGSDTSVTFLSDSVRRVHWFGHFCRFFKRFRPKGTWVRTLLPLFQAVLSEGWTGSDTSASFSSDSVRRWTGPDIPD
ncbi:hypothetical protein [Neobacillus citreus]|uniref:hypothetical protein n=1 Tax=Neobacillus citreus TaxID=2833578 RepID=UPI001F141DE7|nr:hypothetical protein [Neobacillus citreus]